MSEATTVRGKVLDEARNLTEGDRNVAYGDPYENLKNQAAFINEYLRQRELLCEGKELLPHDIAEIYAMGKLVRRLHNTAHRDSYVDAAAYIAIAYGCFQSGLDDMAHEFLDLVDALGTN